MSGVSRTAEDKYIFDKVKRALRHAKARGLRLSVTKALKQLELYSPGGIYLGRAKGIRFEWSRLKHTAKRILVSLYSDKTGHLMPDGYEATIYSSHLQNSSEEFEDPIVKEAEFIY